MDTDSPLYDYYCGTEKVDIPLDQIRLMIAESNWSQATEHEITTMAQGPTLFFNRLDNPRLFSNDAEAHNLAFYTFVAPPTPNVTWSSGKGKKEHIKNHPKITTGVYIPVHETIMESSWHH
eukprot:TRINITY_DN2481_c0_g2_i2.p1 TRINITY_DN2481_c0_g2~~TRINITY_DN2481_c0_g2_i2.p1  ORF type:complete len:121 (-),score=30.64 TRINITY_DN2481_c0_g2_i2:241-603(-)